MSEKKEIILFGRGLVIIADPEDAKSRRRFDVDWVRYSCATTIRTWGTTDGIGQLAHSGPTSSTVLDHIPHSIDIPVSAIHMIIECSQDSIEQFTPAIEQAEKRLLR